jgi:tetraacyldisaccharide 4'-kinase
VRGIQELAKDDWYQPKLTRAARRYLPLAWQFGAVAALRRLAFRFGLKRSTRLDVPVVVLGNLIVGGAGKTPLTIWLANALRAAGWQPGIVSRGYGGSVSKAGQVMAVDAQSLAAECGDEPLLIAKATGCPVFIGANRVAAAQALRRAHPSCNVILCDDGLQHYALQRDIEIAVFDARGIGNGVLFPAGPLREPLRRLRRVQAVVLNGVEAVAGLREPHPHTFNMYLQTVECYPVLQPVRRIAVDNWSAEFAGRPVVAAAGIAHPMRFFGHLAGLGVVAQPMPFPDHHAYRLADFANLPKGAVVLMTEKDTVKCISLGLDQLDATFYAVPVDPQVDPALLALVQSLLRTSHGFQTA